MFSVAGRQHIVDFQKVTLTSLLHGDRLHRSAEESPAFDSGLVIQLPFEIRRVVQLRLAIGVV